MANVLCSCEGAPCLAHVSVNTKKEKLYVSSWSRFTPSYGARDLSIFICFVLSSHMSLYTAVALQLTEVTTRASAEFSIHPDVSQDMDSSKPGIQGFPPLARYGWSVTGSTWTATLIHALITHHPDTPGLGTVAFYTGPLTNHSASRQK